MVRKVKVLNLNLNLIDDEVLGSIAKAVEETIRKELAGILGPRLIDFLITVKVSRDEDGVNLAVALDVDAYLPSGKAYLNAVVDKAMRRAFDHAEQLLSRYRAVNQSAKGGLQRNDTNAQ